MVKTNSSSQNVSSDRTSGFSYREVLSLKASKTETQNFKSLEGKPSYAAQQVILNSGFVHLQKKSGHSIKALFTKEKELDPNVKLFQCANGNILIEEIKKLMMWDPVAKKIICTIEKEEGKIEKVVANESQIAFVCNRQLCLYSRNKSGEMAKDWHIDISCIKPHSLAIVDDTVALSFDDGSIGYYKKDGTITWSQICQKPITCMVNHPLNPNLLLIGSKEGLFVLDVKAAKSKKMSDVPVMHIDMVKEQCFALSPSGKIEGWEISKEGQFAWMTEIIPKKSIEPVALKIGRTVASTSLYLVSKHRVDFFQISKKA